MSDIFVSYTSLRPGLGLLDRQGAATDRLGQGCNPLASRWHLAGHFELVRVAVEGQSAELPLFPNRTDNTRPRSPAGSTGWLLNFTQATARWGSVR